MDDCFDLVDDIGKLAGWPGCRVWAPRRAMPSRATMSRQSPPPMLIYAGGRRHGQSLSSMPAREKWYKPSHDASPLVDQFARRITYLRLSVTDRCDLRCAYCMPERQTFLPRAEVLSLEELHELALGFIARGITKIRLTGGEPLVRRDMIELVHAIGRKLEMAWRSSRSLPMPPAWRNSPTICAPPACGA